MSLLIIFIIDAGTSFGHGLRDQLDPNGMVTSLIRKNDSIAIFKDGSKIGGQDFVEVAAICLQLNQADLLSVDCRSSTYTVRSVALNSVIDIGISKKIVSPFVFTDSLSVLLSLGKTDLTADSSKIILLIRTAIPFISLIIPRQKLNSFGFPLT